MTKSTTFSKRFRAKRSSLVRLKLSHHTCGTASMNRLVEVETLNDRRNRQLKRSTQGWYMLADVVIVIIIFAVLILIHFFLMGINAKSMKS